MVAARQRIHLLRRCQFAHGVVEIQRMTWTFQHDQIGKLEHFPPRIPARQQSIGVTADHPGKRCLRMPGSQFAQRFDRERQLRPVHLSIIRPQSFSISTGQRKHRPTILDAGARRVFVGWTSGQNQTDLTQIKGLANCLGSMQMANMNGIECAAKQTDQRCRISPLPRTTYF